MRAFTNPGGVAGACALAGATRTAAMSVQRMAKAAANDGAHQSGRARCIQSERAARPNMRATKQAVKAASVGATTGRRTPN